MAIEDREFPRAIKKGILIAHPFSAVKGLDKGKQIEPQTKT